MITLTEGYWADGYWADGQWHLKNFNGYVNYYPMPVPYLHKWEKEAFLENLTYAEKIAKAVGFRGSSACRLCGERVGYREYKYTYHDLKFVWPEGLRHYIEKHNVRPSLMFEQFIRNLPEIHAIVCDSQED